jgi:hypothetical protein
MATVTFNGAAKTITIGYDAAITEVDAYEIYSLWKEWVVAGNAQFLPAFGDSVGGNTVSASLSLGAFVFLRNDLGWRIVPADVDHELRVAGDIYPSDSNLPIFTPPATASVLAVIQRSATALAVGGTLTVESIVEAVWNALASEFNTAGTFGELVQNNVGVDYDRILREVRNALLPHIWGAA